MNKIRYKLLNQDNTSYGNCKWTLKEWKKTDGVGALCSEGWLHCYTNPLLAVLLNTIHGDFANPKLYKCEVRGRSRTDLGRKEGWSEMRIVEEIKLPKISIKQKVAFALLCSIELVKVLGPRRDYLEYEYREYVKWAKKWVSGEDRDSLKSYMPCLYFDCIEDVKRIIEFRHIKVNDYDISYDVAEFADFVVSRTNNHMNLIKLAKQAMKAK